MPTPIPNDEIGFGIGSQTPRHTADGFAMTSARDVGVQRGQAG
jgi:hypothetical protein